uniref:Uncharacterized protein n=1 Tax=Picea glauca TaxID=3330 RepID=A0A101LZC8_PICGL|nr:hypothetical protein ABT39_MTgene5160 [Picea glauca]
MRKRNRIIFQRKKNRQRKKSKFVLYIYIWQSDSNPKGKANNKDWFSNSTQPESIHLPLFLKWFSVNRTKNDHIYWRLLRSHGINHCTSHSFNCTSKRRKHGNREKTEITLEHLRDTAITGDHLSKEY